jgi:hypothetical protein
MSFMRMFKRSHRPPEPSAFDPLAPQSRERFVGSGLVKSPQNPNAAYHSPADIGRDQSLDRGERIRLLGKWLKLASERYHETGEIEDLNEVRQANRMLTALRQHRNDY